MHERLGCGICSFENRDAYFPPTVRVASNIFAPNEPPHPSESFALRKSLTEMKGELEKVNADIELAEAALSRMKIAQLRILSSINQHGKALRPILSVPDDVLRLIFEWSVILGSAMKRDDLLDSRIASPWTLSHTCRHWRTISLSHSRLWCDIYTPLDKDRRHLLELSLQRSSSAQCGLDVDIQYRDTKNDAPHESFVKVIAPLLKPTSQRWRSLTVYTSWEFVNELFGGWTFQRITSLDLSFRVHRYMALDQPRLITAFRDTPNLVRLSVENFTSDDVLEIRWKKLAFYESRYSDLRTFKRLSAVETIIIDDNDYTSWPVTFAAMKAMSPIRLPCLHSLSVLFNSDDNMVSDLSDVLEVDALRRLHISFRTHLAPDKRCPNVHFLYHLTHLSIVMEDDSDYLLDVLHRAECVRVLHIGGNALTATVLNALQSQDTLPFLECLHVAESVMDDLADEVFMVMEAKHCRLNIVSDMEVEYDWESDLSDEALERYRSLNERGMITTGMNRDFEF